ncbi:hypothetical protein LCGC14_2295030 [marine sediment metagenome]|uniref:Uncharacterized protein n=1 Tax=marine sediment metagenome TaxID=412755 RepID=A0A0F9CQ37_9ZZZZ
MTDLSALERELVEVLQDIVYWDRPSPGRKAKSWSQLMATARAVIAKTTKR